MWLSCLTLSLNSGLLVSILPLFLLYTEKLKLPSCFQPSLKTCALTVALTGPWFPPRTETIGFWLLVPHVCAYVFSDRVCYKCINRWIYVSWSPTGYPTPETGKQTSEWSVSTCPALTPAVMPGELFRAGQFLLWTATSCSKGTSVAWLSSDRKEAALVSKVVYFTFICSRILLFFCLLPT